MKKIIFIFVIFALLFPNINLVSNASLVTDKNYRNEQKKFERNELKQIKNLFNVHYEFANRHDIESLKLLYADNYINNDGFNKEVYFKNIKETWDECQDLTYKMNIESANIEGEHASVIVEETATGTVFDNIESGPAAGEIHSKSKGIYHLTKVNDKWLISGETVLFDESSLLYGDARFMNISLITPAQVSSEEQYTATVQVDTKDKIYMIGSIQHEPVTYPSEKSNAPLRVVPQTNVLERIIKANNNNMNEYAVASLAISKTKNEGLENFRIYMAGLACIMKRVNVVPKNNYIKIEEKK